jgi:hypothetical protein
VISTRAGLAIAAAACATLAAGCQNPPGMPSTPATSVSASPQPAAATTPAPGVTAAASPGALAQPATLEVSPPEVRLGNFVVSLAFEPPRHMVDKTMVSNSANQDPAHPTPAVPEGASKGAVVLDDMLRVTNNMDTAQLVPPDAAQSIVRHAVLSVKNGPGSQPVPYLTINMDMLLDGRPVSFGQAVVPMVAGEADPPNMYYGNNVRIGQRGMYQVFVRMAYNPLLGKGQPQAAQFNVLVR